MVVYIFYLICVYTLSWYHLHGVASHICSWVPIPSKCIWSGFVLNGTDMAISLDTKSMAEIVIHVWNGNMIYQYFTWQFSITLRLQLFSKSLQTSCFNWAVKYGSACRFSDKCTKIYLYWSYTCLHTRKISTIHYFFYITTVKDQTFAFCGLWGQTEIFIFKMVQKLYLSQLNLQPKKLCLACLEAI